jgi:hypothetical protein
MDKMRLYRWPDDKDGLPKEDVWLNEDWPESYYYSNVRPEEIRNLELYVPDSDPHHNVWMRFQRKQRLSYQDVESIESFLKQNPGVEVVSQQGQIFIKTWMD